MSNPQTPDREGSKPALLARLKTPEALRWLEISLAVIVSLGIGIVFSLYARGGPNSSDITLYMNVGMNGIKMPFILNRYFHVFLQTIFVKIAPTPLQGYHAFWGFIIGANALLIYLSARMALKRSNVLHGLLAVLIFFSFSAVAETAGVIVVDFTAMTMITAFFLIYLLSVNQGHRNPWLVGALGFVLYLAFKTKETTLPGAVLLIGLGWADGDPFDFRRLLKNALWVLCGGLGGVVFFGMLSWIFMGDPFFGLRLSEWREFLDTYAVYSSRVLETMNALGDGNLDDWYKGYWFEFTLLPFLFYLISGIKLDRKVSVARKLLWLVPLAYTLLLMVTINNRLGYEIRFGLPVLPVLAILGPQFIKIQWPAARHEQRRLLLFAAIGLAVAVGIRLILRIVVPARGLDLGSVVILMYYPVLISILFASLILFRGKIAWHVVNAVILISLMVSPVTSNLRTMFILRENQARFTETILPLVEFEDRIEFHPNTEFYITYAVFHQHELKIGKNIDELVALFNVFFDTDAGRENFTYLDAPQDIAGDLLSGSYDYALITMADWIAMQEPENKLAQVKANYEIVFGSGGDFVLLISDSAS